MGGLGCQGKSEPILQTPAVTGAPAGIIATFHNQGAHPHIATNLKTNSLPIFSLREELGDAFSLPRARAVLRAPTGSGKSTQIPQFILDDALCGGGEIVVLEPRRIAARMLASRVAKERGGRPGGEVGYEVRFDRAISGATKIRFVTEGTFVRQILGDRELKGVGAVVFDEFHERHIDGDLALAMTVKLQEDVRPDLRIAVMSATILTENLISYLGEGAQVLEAEGRAYPVDIQHRRPNKKEAGKGVWEAAASTCEQLIVKDCHPGDALIFMPGSFEIQRTISTLEKSRWARDFDILPLHGQLSAERQDRAVAPSTRRKVIVATNVAETSLTIDGVRIVIDSGLARVARYDAGRGINTLLVEKISRASADQRAGRAGRTAEGTCIRLWDERDHGARAAESSPEIHRVDLSEAILSLKSSGVNDTRTFPWLDPPKPEALQRALNLLDELGATTHDGSATSTGKNLARLPLHPRLGTLLLAADDANYAREAAVAAALLSGRPMFLKKDGAEQHAYREDTSDFAPLFRAFGTALRSRFDTAVCSRIGVRATAAREAAKIASRLLGSLAYKDTTPSDLQNPGEGFAKALVRAFPDHLARVTSKGTLGCDVAGGRRGRIDPSSVVRSADLVVATEIAEVEGREIKVTLRNVTEVRREWLDEIFPGSIKREDTCVFDPAARRAVRREIVRFRDLVLESREAGEPDPAQASALLAEEVAAGNLVLKTWDSKVDAWVARLNCLAEWMPDYELPPLDLEAKQLVLEQICRGATTYKQIRDRPVWNAIRSWLQPYQHDLLDRYAPEQFALASGRNPRIRYVEGEPPTLSATVQDLYDQNKTPSIADGRVSLRVEILGPNRRPVQVTNDLAGFWENSYEAVKKQLKGRYPKHEWR